MGNFYTDTIKKDPRFMTVNQVNDPALLEPVFRSRVEKIIARAATKGVQLVYGETYRSLTRQVHLFNTGASKLKNVGVHHFGLAADLWIEHHDAKPDWKANYLQLGPWIAEVGLVWGYDWGAPKAKHTFRDIDHVQGCRIEDQSKLFAGLWYPAGEWSPMPIRAG